MLVNIIESPLICISKTEKDKKAKDIRQYNETKARLQKAERQPYWQLLNWFPACQGLKKS